MPFVAHPHPHPDPELDVVSSTLDPVLSPLGFAPGQLGVSGMHAQAIFCHGFEGSVDGGCVDLVVDLEATPTWRIADVRYWGYPADQWHLAFLRDGDLAAQLAQLAHTLPTDLA